MKRIGVIKTREFVTLRFRRTSKGLQSLFLDVYKEGSRSYEFLKLYLIPELTLQDKVTNKETLRKAEMMKARRTWELYSMEESGKNRTGEKIPDEEKTSGEETPSPEITLIEWLRKYASKKLEKGQSDAFSRQIDKTARHLQIYRQDDMKLNEVTKEYCAGFIHYLKNASLSPHTAFSYLRCLNCALNDAVKEELMSVNPMKRLSKDEKIKQPDNTRHYLNMDEIAILIKSPSPYEEVKQAYLFSCMSGLRISDIKNLKWSNLEKSDGQWRIVFKAKKTGKMQYLPLSEEAMLWLPEKRDSAYIFHLPSESYINILLKKWVERSGITKRITFHTARHTYATMLITLGVDIYTVSKLLGHAQISTTQIYAKIVDKKKEEAIHLIPHFSVSANEDKNEFPPAAL